jgi:cytoplasmic iron level regulating protein YaaA (DUF328/UPF0246 family)
MSRYIIDHQLTDPQDIKGFDVNGYRFNNKLSKDDQWVFSRS